MVGLSATHILVLGPSVALRWLGIDMRRIWLPLAVSIAVFTVLYYAIVWVGIFRVPKMGLFGHLLIISLLQKC